MENKITINELISIENQIINILNTDIKKIINNTRRNMIVVEEKNDGDSATIADIKIGKIFDKLLPKLLKNSIVIQEESFNINVFNKLKDYKYIWVVDPIDGTKAFRDTKNFEWCVGCCLLENLSPIFSAIYIPEPWLSEPLLLTANKYRPNLLNFGKEYIQKQSINKKIYISHIHKDEQRNTIENKIAEMFDNNGIIKAYAGHSTLAQFLSVATNPEKVFSRRQANIWDIIQSAYIVEKSGGEVYYENGENIFPLNINNFQFKDNHLIMPFTIASSHKNKQLIMTKLKR